MMNLRPFEIVLIGIFGAAAIAGLIYVSFGGPDGSNSSKENPYGKSVVIWGTFDTSYFEQLLGAATQVDANLKIVSYVQKDPDTIDAEFVNAIAEGRSPDLLILPHSKLLMHRSKLSPISYETLKERDFRDTYVDGAGIFMRSDGIYGIPFAVDPLVLYWNRDLFSSSGLANPPQTWEQLVSETTPAITRKDAQLNISRSAIAFGEYANTAHPKEILAMLLLQVGSTLVEEREKAYVVTLNNVNGTGMPPGDAVLSFYTQFSTPTHQNYSWNRSLQGDRLSFLAGDLGMYFGFGSELYDLKRSNPNLNFDVAPVPQGSTANTLRNYAEFYAFAIPRASQNQFGALSVAGVLGNIQNAQQIDELFNLAPVHRATIAVGSSNPFLQTIYQSALISRGWLDPNPVKSDEVFREMIESVTSGRSRFSDAVYDAVRRLELLLR